MVIVACSEMDIGFILCFYCASRNFSELLCFVIRDHLFAFSILLPPPRPF